jgi:type II secretory pathway pseudopilin PulG
MRKPVLKNYIDFLKKKKLRASSIVEVIVALAICMILFAISMSVIVNSQRSNNIRLKQKAQFILSTIDANTLKQDSNLENGSLRLEATIQKNDTIAGVSRITYSIFDNAGHRIGMKVIWLAIDKLSHSETEISKN